MNCTNCVCQAYWTRQNKFRELYLSSMLDWHLSKFARVVFIKHTALRSEISLQVVLGLIVYFMIFIVMVLEDSASCYFIVYLYDWHASLELADRKSVV